MMISTANKLVQSRYEIYEISDKKITIINNGCRYEIHLKISDKKITIINNESMVKGKVKEVYRNPSDRSIIISMSNKKLVFHEPDNIVRDGNKIMLIYGDDSQSDKEMFEQMELNFGMDINQFLSEIPDCKRITFEIDE